MSKYLDVDLLVGEIKNIENFFQSLVRLMEPIL